MKILHELSWLWETLGIALLAAAICNKRTVTLTLFMSVLPNRIYIQKNFRRHTAVHIPKKS